MIIINVILWDIIFVTSQPIIDKLLIEAMKNDLKRHNYRDYMLMLMQSNVGLRVGDVIGLKVVDIKDKTYLDITEHKTKKTKHVLLNSQLKNELNDYIKDMNDRDHLFPSRQMNSDGTKNYISRIQVYRILTWSAVRVGIQNFSTHSLRKTFGWFYYQQTHDVAKLMDIFNYSNQSATLIYIGVHQAEIDKTLENFYL